MFLAEEVRRNPLHESRMTAHGRRPRKCPGHNFLPARSLIPSTCTSLKMPVDTFLLGRQKQWSRIHIPQLFKVRLRPAADVRRGGRTLATALGSENRERGPASVLSSRAPPRPYAPHAAPIVGTQPMAAVPRACRAFSFIRDCRIVSIPRSGPRRRGLLAVDAGQVRRNRTHPFAGRRCNLPAMIGP